MKTSERGRDLIQSFEACRLTAYPDPLTGKSPWTCGWGSTGPSIGPGTTWTQEQADERFGVDLAGFEAMIDDAVTVELTQGQFDALVSILYNVGPGSSRRDGIVKLKSGNPSTLLRFVNAGDFAKAARQFLLWVSPGSAVERGLRRRREAEMELFLSESPPTQRFRFAQD